MKKVFLVHGFEGSPNGGWRPWLMGELEKQDIYACALAMPSPADPVLEEWVNEIARYAEWESDAEIYLVAHSLGVPTVLHYLETAPRPISGAVLCSGPCEPVENKKIEGFIDRPFDFEKIRENCPKFVVIHGNNDMSVPLEHARKLEEGLRGKLVIVPNGGHLNGSSGWTQLPQALDALNNMFG
jgi:uncharacterized protein